MAEVKNFALNNKKKINTPKGEALWAFLAKPDTRHGKSEYHVSLVLDEGNAFFDKIHELVDEAWERHTAEMKPGHVKKSVKVLPMRPVEDEEGNETDQVKIRMKSPQFKPKVFDAKNRQLKDIPLIGNGSEIRISFSAKSYKRKGDDGQWQIGIVMYVNAVQIVKLLDFQADFGFEEEEDGFDAENDPFTVPTEEVETETPDNDPDDGEDF